MSDIHDIFPGTVNAMLEPYVAFCENTSTQPTVQLQGFEEWCEKLLRMKLFIYCLKFYIHIDYSFLFHAGVRRNNQNMLVSPSPRCGRGVQEWVSPSWKGVSGVPARKFLKICILVANCLTKLRYLVNLEECRFILQLVGQWVLLAICRPGLWVIWGLWSVDPLVTIFNGCMAPPKSVHILI